MRIYFLSIALALATGFFYGVCTDPEVYVAFCDNFWHDTFSGCPCVEDRRRGYETLRQLEPIGKCTDQLAKLAGPPSYIRKISYDDDPFARIIVGPIDRKDDRYIDEMWYYPTIFLHIKDGRCIRAYPRTSILHFGESSEHMLIRWILKEIARSQGIPDLSTATGN